MSVICVCSPALLVARRGNVMPVWCGGRNVSEWLARVCGRRSVLVRADGGSLPVGLSFEREGGMW